jgi:hypothetical protein
MKKSPVYLELRDKYKALKKRNAQLVEMLLDMRALYDEAKLARTNVVIKTEPGQIDIDLSQDSDSGPEETVELVEEEVEIVEEEEVETVEEEVEIVEEEEVEIVEEEEVEIVEEEEVETVEETVETVEEEEGQEEEGVYEIEIGGKMYYTTNEQNGEVYEILEGDEVGDQVGKFIGGKYVEGV